MIERKIYTALISTPGESGGTAYLKCDVIKFENKFWLVPNWLEDDLGLVKTPSRLICISTLEHQKLQNPKLGDFLVKVPIPRNVLYSEITEEDKESFQILEYPELDDIPAAGSH